MVCYKNVHGPIEGREKPRTENDAIVGLLQAGKTTLMEMLKEYLEKSGERTMFLNLDIEWDRPHFESQAALIKKIELEIGRQSGYVFIDEIQRKDDAGLFLKGLSDLKLPYKFILSGSGSLELKQKIHESLVGRKKLFELSTVTFEEFINYWTENRYEENLAEFLAIETDRAQQLLSEYMQFGGYPRIVAAAEQREKLRLIDEIYRTLFLGFRF
ncbi:MAG: AAA family ATPase [Desulfobacterales bacterium]